jgi:hypothetical protein
VVTLESQDANTAENCQIYEAPDTQLQGQLATSSVYKLVRSSHEKTLVMSRDSQVTWRHS